MSHHSDSNTASGGTGSDDAKFGDGMRRRRQVLGDAYVDRALAAVTPFSAPLQQLVTANAWGETWGRPGLDLKTRSMITIAMLIALNRTHELKVHLRGGVNNGLSATEMRELFLHASAYCGFPACVDAFRTAAEVFDADFLNAPELKD